MAVGPKVKKGIKPASPAKKGRPMKPTPAGTLKARGGKMAKGYAKGGAKMMKARGGKMAKGYAKGGAKMMKAMGGKMAKGYAKGGAKMSVASLRAQAKKMGYKITKG
tara:strand:+ start:95 stop:415 length:321 start_codon:yes stop_codon:yes gene_type:complete